MPTIGLETHINILSKLRFVEQLIVIGYRRIRQLADRYKNGHKRVHVDRDPSANFHSFKSCRFNIKVNKFQIRNRTIRIRMYHHKLNGLIVSCLVVVRK